MKFLLKLFKKPSTSSIPTIASVVDEEIPRYPPFAKGLPAASVPRIIATQSELIKSIRHTLALPDAEFNSIVVPVIERYAAFTHLLPASEAHHHRGAGGLFRHGLEVAYWAAMASEGVLFGAGNTPLERKSQEPRWRLSICLAGLLHDIGKPVSDLSILDREGLTQWNPYIENLTEWAEKNSVDRYFLRWRDKRHQRHEQFSVLVTERVLTPNCLSYLTQTGPEIMQFMLEAIAGIDRGSMFHTLVNEADRKSVERDLKANHIAVDISMGVPVEKYILDAIRRLINENQWQVNKQGARVWRFQTGVHIVWKLGAQDISEMLARDKVPGIPRDPDTLADILIERGLAIPRVMEDGKTFRYWRMVPEGIQATLNMLRLVSPDLLFSGEPPLIVEGSMLEEDENIKQILASKVPKKVSQPTMTSNRTEKQIHESPRHATPLFVPEVIPNDYETDDYDVYFASESDSEAAYLEFTGFIENEPRETENTDNLLKKTIQSETNIKHSGNAESGASKTTENTKKPATQSFKDSHLRESVPVEDKSTSSAQVAAKQKALQFIKSKGRAGEWLESLINLYTQSADDIPVLQANGLIFIAHPGLAIAMKLEPSELLSMLDSGGLIETDMLAPLRKIREVNGIRGILLNNETSRCWKILTEVGQPLLSSTDKPRPTSITPVEQERKAPNETANTKAKIVSGSSAPTSIPDTTRKESTHLSVNDDKANANQNEMPEANRKQQDANSRTDQQHENTNAPKAKTTSKTTKQKEPQFPLERKSLSVAVDDLIRRIKENENLPCERIETNDGIQIPMTIIDWYTEMHTDIKRARLICDLRLHPGIEIKNNETLIVKLGEKK
jgi:hypothetical protein